MLSGDPALAQDITSETFLHVWIAEQPVRAVSVRAWLFVIARNIYLHELRRLRRTAPLDPAMPAAGSLSTSVETRDELSRAMKALALLPELDRTALLMRVAEGFPYSRIAATLRISLAAAKVKVYRGASV